MLADVWKRVADSFKRPFDPAMDFWGWFLLFGILIVISVAWREVLQVSRKTIEAVAD